VGAGRHAQPHGSGDSTTTPEEIATAVADSAIDVLCITDHNAIKGAVDLVERLPCRVIVGEELRTHAGEIIGLFLDERIPVCLQPDDAARAIRSQGGIVYIPHPYDPMTQLNEAALNRSSTPPGRCDRSDQRQDVVAQPQRPGCRGRRRADPQPAPWQRRPRSRRDRCSLRGDARLHGPRLLDSRAAPTRRPLLDQPVQRSARVLPGTTIE
jgi:predicted metal-dependent phosphoesterase TrpH